MSQNQFRVNRVTKRLEFFIIGVAVVAAFAMSSKFDVFERFVAWSGAHDTWQVDELATMLVVLTFGVCIFAWRRLGELRAEVRRRQSAEESLRRSQRSFKQIVDFIIANLIPSRVLFDPKSAIDSLKPACIAKICCFSISGALVGVGVRGFYMLMVS